MPNYSERTQAAGMGDPKLQQFQYRYDQLLADLARTSKSVWTAPDLSVSLQQVLATFGENLDIDRARLFQYSLNQNNGEPFINLRYEWNRINGIEEADFIPSQKIALFPDFTELYSDLMSGKPFISNANNFPEPSRTTLFSSGIEEILALPIFAENITSGENSFWGLILLEVYQSSRVWDPGEISILQIAASNIGGAISRMRTEEALKESDHRFRTILNSIQAGIIIIQADSLVIVALNNAAQKMIGVRYETVIGKDIEKFIPRSNKNFPGTYQGSLENQEGILITGSGERIPILRKPVYLTIDRTNYVVETFLSIAERKQSERIQNEQRIIAEAMRDIANAINQSLHLSEVLDTILSSVDKVLPNDAANIMLIDGAITRVVACRGYEDRGGNERVMSTGREVNDVPNLKKMADTGLPTVVSDTDQASDWINFTTSTCIKSYASAPICRNGKTIGFINLNSETPGFYQPSHAERLLSFSDQAAIAIENARLYENAQKEIEDRKKAEEALQQSNNLLEEHVEQRTIELRNANQQLTQELKRRIQAEQTLEEERSQLAIRVEERTAELSTVNAQLARAARLKDTFLASMSHELRTPLNTILNISETLQEQVYGDLNPSQQKSMHRIEEGGRHLLALINDILDLSKIGAGKLDLVWDSVSVQALCNSSIQYMDEAARKKNLEFKLNLDPTVRNIWADQRRLKQILVNLLSNAVKFTPQNGTVSLTVSGNQDRKQVSFAVTDTGIGISPDRMELLFKPFVQLDNSLARQYEGTGLGLALVYSLVDLHNGGIRVESEQGKGSQFIVTLNWDEAEDNSHVDQFVTRDGQVEDNSKKFSLQGKRVDLYLRDYGIEMTTIWMDQDFINVLDSLAPDIVVIDLDELPSGTEIMRKMALDHRTSNIPLLLTGSGEQPPDANFLTLHTVFLQTPFNRLDLINAMRKIAPRGTGGLIHHLTFLREKFKSVEENRLHILIADDNENSARAVSDFLTSRGHHVTIAYNGAEAIERTRETHPDLILMDIQMPGMDGLEAIRRIRRDEKGEQTPIIAITALAMTGDRKRCLDAGANEYLSKPLSIKELSELIESQTIRKAK